MANVSFRKGTLKNLPSTKVAGTFYVTTDERGLYLDLDNSTRIRIGDFQEFASIEALKANANPSTTALYYVSGANCLAKWNGTDYVQINLDTGMTSVEVVGSGNAVTSANYNASTRKLTLTMGETFATLSGMQTAIADNTGDLTYNGTKHTTVKSYVDAKTTGIATDAALSELQGRVDLAEDAIDALEEKVGSQSVSTQIDAKIEALKLADTYETKGSAATALAEAKAYTDTRDSLIATATETANYAKEHVDNLTSKVGTVPTNKTVVQMIADAQAAATYDDTALANRVTTAEGKITTMIGGDSGKSIRAIANEELATQLIADNAKEALNTLSEIAAWIQSHPDDASAMNAAIVALQNKVDTGDKTVVTYVTDAIKAMKIGDYAKAADLTALASRVTILEGDSHTHSNSAELAKIQSGDVAKWNAAESNAKAHADSLASQCNEAVATAEANAKKYAKGLDESMDSRMKIVEAALGDNGSVDTDIASAQAAAETKAANLATAAEESAKSYADSLVLTWGSF